MSTSFKIAVDKPSDLIDAAQEPDEWIVEGLIEAGDQVMIAGNPKAGKSLIASQLSIAVASGGKFLSWNIPQPRRVLYVNLELRRKRFGKRLIAQIGGVDSLERCSNLHTVNELRTIDIRNRNCIDEFAALVKSLQIELIVWDVLARMHNAEENDNPEMRKVMHAIRVASADRAHVVLHHARKPANGQENVNMGAAGMRGASSIHGEADLIMSLHVRSGQGARYSLKFSARNIEEPDEMLLDRDPTTLLFYQADEAEANRLQSVIRNVFDVDTSCKPKELTDAVMNAFEVKERRAKQLIQSAMQQGWISPITLNGRRQGYQLLEPDDLLCQAQVTAG